MAISRIPLSKSVWRWITQPQGRWALFDVMLMVLLFLWGWRFFQPLESVINIELFDETGDLWTALRRPLWDYPSGYGPLYHLWYRLLSLFEPDPLHLYYLSYRLVAVGLPVALYWALRRARVVPWVALGAALLVLLSRMHVTLWPRITVFAGLVLCVTLGLVWGRDDRHSWLYALRYAWVYFWVAYVRPSYALLVVFFLGVAFLLGRRDGFRGWHPREGWYWLPALIPLVLWGIPYDSDRFALAFQQHFVVRRAEMGDPIDDPWFDSPEKFAKYFKEARTFWDAFWERPDLVWAHIQMNLQDLPSSIQDFWDFPWPLRLRMALRGRYRQVLGGLGFLLLFLLPVKVLVPRWFDIEGWRIRALQMAGPLAALFTVGFAVVTIYPQHHYLYMAFLVLFLLGALVVSPPIPKFPVRKSEEIGLLLFTGLFLVLAWGLWARYDLTHWVPLPKDPTFRVQTVARTVRALPWRQPLPSRVSVLGAPGEWDVYFGPSFWSVDDTFDNQKNRNLEDFLKAEDVGLILLPASVEEARFCASTSDNLRFCQALKAQPEVYGFRRFPLRLEAKGIRASFDLLVRIDLLEPQSP